MHRVYDKKLTASDIIKQGMQLGKNSVQIFLMVKDRFPNYNDARLRKLISVVKAQQLHK